MSEKSKKLTFLSGPTESKLRQVGVLVFRPATPPPKST